MKFHFSHIILLLLVTCTYTTAQQSHKISRPDLKLVGNNIIINYNIINSNANDLFTIWLEVTDKNGKKIEATSLEGDIGENVNGGNTKEIKWDLTADNVLLDAGVYIQVNAEFIAPVIVEKVPEIKTDTKIKTEAETKTEAVTETHAEAKTDTEAEKDEDIVKTMVYSVDSLLAFGKSFFFSINEDTKAAKEPETKPVDEVTPVSVKEPETKPVDEVAPKSTEETESKTVDKVATESEEVTEADPDKDEEKVKTVVPSVDSLLAFGRSFFFSSHEDTKPEKESKPEPVDKVAANSVEEAQDKPVEEYDIKEVDEVATKSIEESKAKPVDKAVAGSVEEQKTKPVDEIAVKPQEERETKAVEEVASLSLEEPETEAVNKVDTQPVQEPEIKTVPKTEIEEKKEILPVNRIDPLKALGKSMLFPGWGSLPARNNKRSMFIGAVGYSILLTTITTNRIGIAYYNNYLKSDNISTRSYYYEASTNLDRASEICAYVALGIWITDLALTAFEVSKYNEGLKHQKSGHLWIQPVYDANFRSTMLALNYRF